MGQKSKPEYSSYFHARSVGNSIQQTSSKAFLWKQRQHWQEEGAIQRVF